MLRFLRNEDGPTSVEYVFMLVLVFVVVLSGVTMLGESTNQSVQDSSDSIEAAMAGGP